MWLCAASLASCATGTPSPSRETPPASAAEAEFLCAVLPRYLELLGDTNGDAPTLPDSRSEEFASKIVWSRSRIPDCPAGTPPIYWYLRYLDGFGLSADGRMGAISGGWQAAPLAGATGVCYFEKGPGGWAPAGCLLTGIS